MSTKAGQRVNDHAARLEAIDLGQQHLNDLIDREIGRTGVNQANMTCLNQIGRPEPSATIR